MAELTSKWIRPAKRYAIYNRDGYCCAYCGKGAESGIVLTLDHVLCRELGGGNEATNLITACVSCNSSKQDKSTRAWFAVLRAKGVKTDKLADRIRNATRRVLDMEAGRKAVALRKGAQSSEVAAE